MPTGKPLGYAAYDLGQAVAHLSVQAHHDGLHVHQMGGFDRDGVRAAFGLDARFEPLTVIALGPIGDPSRLCPRRCRSARPRRACAGRWPTRSSRSEAATTT